MQGHSVSCMPDNLCFSFFYEISYFLVVYCPWGLPQPMLHGKSKHDEETQ